MCDLEKRRKYEEAIARDWTASDIKKEMFANNSIQITSVKELVGVITPS